MIGKRKKSVQRVCGAYPSNMGIYYQVIRINKSDLYYSNRISSEK